MLTDPIYLLSRRQSICVITTPVVILFFHILLGSHCHGHDTLGLQGDAVAIPDPTKVTRVFLTRCECDSSDGIAYELVVPTCEPHI